MLLLKWTWWTCIIYIMNNLGIYPTMIFLLSFNRLDRYLQPKTILLWWAVHPVFRRILPFSTEHTLPAGFSRIIGGADGPTASPNDKTCTALITSNRPTSWRLCQLFNRQLFVRSWTNKERLVARKRKIFPNEAAHENELRLKLCSSCHGRRCIINTQLRYR